MTSRTGGVTPTSRSPLASKLQWTALPVRAMEGEGVVADGCGGRGEGRLWREGGGTVVEGGEGRGGSGFPWEQLILLDLPSVPIVCIITALQTIKNNRAK